jgi:hypothetical protein
MNMRKTRTGFLTFSLATLLLLSGCGDKPIDDYSELEEIKTATDTEAERQGGMNQFQNLEYWSCDIEVDSDELTAKAVQIGCTPQVPDTSQMSVINVEESEFDDSYRESIVRSIFGNETVYALDRENPTKAMLEQEAEEIQAEIRLLEMDLELNQDNGEDILAEIQSEITDKQEEIAALNREMETAPEQGSSVTTYSADGYTGELDGIVYTLWLEEELGEDTFLTRQKSIKFMPESLQDVCNEEMAEAEGLTICSGDEEENLASITEEEAGQKAEAFLNQIGLAGLEIEGVSSLIWEGTSDGEYLECADGFSVLLGYQEDGKSFGDKPLDWFYDRNEFAWQDIEELAYGTQTSCVVYVTDRGVIGMEYHNPLILTNKTEDVTLLSMDKIQQILTGELEKNPEKYIRYEEAGSDKIKFDTLFLDYFRVQDTENENCYSYIPVWQLCEEKGGVYYNTIAVNAIDGSLIDVYQELFNQGSW